MSYSGVIAAVTSLSRLFIAISGVSYAVEITSPSTPSLSLITSWSLYIDPFSSLYLTYTTLYEPFIITIPIAWQSEIEAAISSQATTSSVDVTCNYLLWSDNLIPTYYIDMARSINITLTLTIASLSSATGTSSLSTMNSLSLSIVDRQRIQFSTSLSLIGRAEASSGGRSQTVRNVIISEANATQSMINSETRRQRVKRLTGSTSIRIAPAQQSPTCTLPMEKTAQVRVGCPPDRHIRLTPSGMLCL
jgi:hypothetical protein